MLPILLLSVSLLGSAGGSNMDHYLGSEYKGNYVWGLAMNLAWHGFIFCSSIRQLVW